MKKKWLAMIVAAVMICSLAACTTTVQTTTSSKLDQIKEAGVFVVGTSPDYPPYEFIIPGADGNIEYVGIDIKIAQEIANDMGVDLKIEAMDFNGLDAALQMGTIDAILAAYNATDERSEVMDFSDEYYIDEVCAFTLLDHVNDFTDLETSFVGKKIGVQLGTTLETDYFPMMTGAEKVALKKVTQLVPELKAGALDAIIVEKPIAEAYVANNPDLGIAPVAFNEGAAGYVVGLPKNAPELKDAVNATIKKLVDSDAIAQFAEDAQSIQDQDISGQQ